MARKLNSTFQGSIAKQAEPGYPSQTEVLENAVGDTALVYDQLTGNNTPTTPIDHTGSGAGVPLGVPLGARALVVNDGATAGGVVQRVSNSVGSSGSVETAYLFMQPIYLPEGETSVAFRVSGCNNAEGARFVCKNTSWADAGEVGEVFSESPNYWEGVARTLTGGNIYFIGMKVRIGPVEPEIIWTGTSVYFPGQQVPHVMTPPDITNANWQQVPLNTQAGPSSSTTIDHEDFDAAMFADDIAYHSYVTTLLNHNQNALVEFMTGAPAGGNNALTLASSTGDDPTSSAFHDHSVSTHSNEEEIDFPIISACLGATEAADTNPDYATDGWGAPGAVNANKNVVANDVCIMPDFKSATGTSRLKCTLLITSPDGTKSGKTNETFYAVTEDAGGVNTEKSTTSFTWMGSSDWAYATLGGGGAGMDFAAGAANQLRISFRDLDGAGTSRARIVGYCWYFDRDA